MSHCVCGSQQDYADCCQPYIDGKTLPATAEALMRARYTAHVQVNLDFIVNTHLETTRHEIDLEATRRWAERCAWQGLEIISTSEGQPGDAHGFVEFVAHYRDRDVRHRHHELAEFEFVDDRWYFKDALTPEVKTAKRATPKLGRNDACSCGSGKKYKKCCGAAAA